MDHRRALICQDLKEAVEVLETSDPKRLLNGVSEAGQKSVVMMFSGQGIPPTGWDSISFCRFQTWAVDRAFSQSKTVQVTERGC